VGQAAQGKHVIEVQLLRVSISVVGRTPIRAYGRPENIRSQRGNQPETRLLTPLMTEEMVITVVTPMTMPRMVSPERSLFALSVSSASLTDSRFALVPWTLQGTGNSLEPDYRRPACDGL